MVELEFLFTWYHSFASATSVSLQFEDAEQTSSVVVISQSIMIMSISGLTRFEENTYLHCLKRERTQSFLILTL